MLRAREQSNTFGDGLDHENGVMPKSGSEPSLGPKKNIVCFRFPTDPIKTCATQIYFMDFQKKKKKKIFFFFFFLGNQ